MPSSKEIQKNISNLSISTKREPKKVTKKDKVAESWEDEDMSSGSDTETETSLRPLPSADLPAVPPPTPSSPTSADRSIHDYSQPFSSDYGTMSPDATRSGDRGERPDKRPDKSMATATRLIAGALGVRPPKPTAEQREYEKAVREKERRRREEEKEKLQEDERKKAAVWDD